MGEEDAEKLEWRPLRLERGVVYRCGFAAGTAVVIGYARVELDASGEAADEETEPALNRLTWSLVVLLVVDVAGEDAEGSSGLFLAIAVTFERILRGREVASSTATLGSSERDGWRAGLCWRLRGPGPRASEEAAILLGRNSDESDFVVLILGTGCLVGDEGLATLGVRRRALELTLALGLVEINEVVGDGGREETAGMKAQVRNGLTLRLSTTCIFTLMPTRSRRLFQSPCAAGWTNRRGTQRGHSSQHICPSCRPRR